MQAQTYQIYTPEDAEKMRIILDTQDWQEGKARTEELTGFIKRNRELKPKVDGEIITTLSSQCTQAIANCPEVACDTVLLKMTSCKFNKYGEEEPDGEYRRHTDAPWMGPCRTDFTAVLALTDPDSYKGGDHWVEDPLKRELQSFRLKQGELLVYETGYAHWVDPVTEGARISALSWIESQLSHERERAIVAMLRGTSRELETAMLEDKEDTRFRKWFVDIGVAHSGLHRLWCNRNT